jgi:hypothetical protein
VETTQNRKGSLVWLRYIGWGGAVALILTPLVAMKVAPDSGVNWTLADFVFAIVMIGSVGLAFEAAVRMSSNWSYRLGAAVGLGTGFLLTWANAAVGYIGDDNPYNIAFFGVVLIAIAGSLAARFRAHGMAVAMLVTAVAHAIAGGFGYPDDPVTGPITIVFVALWLASAALFRKAAQQGR